MNAQAAGMLLIGLAVAGCADVGVAVHEFKPAQGPHGVHVKLALDDNIVEDDEIEGELLAVSADGMILNVRNAEGKGGPARLVLVPFSMIETARPEQMRRVRIDSRDREEYRDELRLVARFPQGLSDDLLAVLLAESGQAQLELPLTSPR